MLALAIFYLITKMTLRRPLPVVLLLGAALSITGTLFQDVIFGQQPKLFRCLIFFLIGVRMKDQIMGFARAATTTRAAFLGAAYLAGATAMHGTNNFALPVDMVAVAFGVTLCQVIATRWAVVMEPARWMAGLTLPVYLIHFPLIHALAWLGDRFLPQSMLGNFWIGLIAPTLSVPVLIVASLAIFRLLSSIGAGWLFDLPFERPASPPAPEPLIASQPQPSQT